MFGKGRLYLETYGSTFMQHERIFRYRKSSWSDVMRELIIDRGLLLGSKAFEEMSGIEKADSLKQIDCAVTECFTQMDALRVQRDHTIPMRFGFRHRCERVRRRISAMDDTTLGMGEQE